MGPSGLGLLPIRTSYTGLGSDANLPARESGGLFSRTSGNRVAETAAIGVDEAHEGLTIGIDRLPDAVGAGGVGGPHRAGGVTSATEGSFHSTLAVINLTATFGVGFTTKHAD